MNNGKQKALPRWDTPHKKDDWNEKKECPDAGMILKRNKKAEAVIDPRPYCLTENPVKNHQYYNSK
jgi:hypothetical protein